MSATNHGNTVGSDEAHLGGALVRYGPSQVDEWKYHLWRMENDPLYRHQQDRLYAKRLAAMEEMQRLCEKWGLDDD